MLANVIIESLAISFLIVMVLLVLLIKLYGRPQLGVIKTLNKFRNILNGVIIYKGKYGATHQYAGWLSERLGLPIADPQNCKDELNSHDLVILGSSVYLGKLQLTNWLHSNVGIIKGKKIILFIVCSTPANEKEKLASYVQSSVPAEIRDQCQIYFLPGRLVYKDLSWKDKFMLRMGAMLSRNPNTKKAMLTDYDGVKKRNLIKLVRSARDICDKPGILRHA